MIFKGGSRHNLSLKIDLWAGHAMARPYKSLSKKSKGLKKSKKQNKK